MTTRRSFLTACIASFSAPAIVRASSLMPVKVRRHWMEGMPINEWVWTSPYTNFGDVSYIEITDLYGQKRYLPLTKCPSFEFSF